LTDDSVETELLTDEPAALPGWDRGQFTGKSQNHISVYKVSGAPGG
jgi:hypothetical protein